MEEWARLLALPALLGFVWLIRLEGRHNAHEQVCETRQHDLESRLERMEDKLDRLVEGR